MNYGVVNGRLQRKEEQKQADVPRVPDAPAPAPQVKEEEEEEEEERLARESCARGAYGVVDKGPRLPLTLVDEVGEYCATESTGHRQRTAQGAPISSVFTRKSDAADMVEKARAARFGADGKRVEKEEDEEEEKRQAELRHAHDQPKK